MICEKCIKYYDCKRTDCNGFIEEITKRIPFEYNGKQYIGISYNYYVKGEPERYGIFIINDKGSTEIYKLFADGYYDKDDFIKEMQYSERLEAEAKNKKMSNRKWW